METVSASFSPPSEEAVSRFRMREAIESIAGGFCLFDMEDRLVECNRRYRETIPMINADSVKLRQILLNLLSNAGKFTHEGEINFTVLVENTPESGWLVYKVSNMVTIAMQGSVSVESEPGYGPCFIICFPKNQNNCV